MKLDADEKVLESIERGEWKSTGGRRERARYSRYAKATFRKDRRLNIRLSSKDLEAIQKRALAEGLPYQTLIASLLHKYATGRLKEVWAGVTSSSFEIATTSPGFTVRTAVHPAAHETARSWRTSSRERPCLSRHPARLRSLGRSGR